MKTRNILFAWMGASTDADRGHLLLLDAPSCVEAMIR